MSIFFRSVHIYLTPVTHFANLLDPQQHTEGPRTFFILFQNFNLYHLRNFPQLEITLPDVPMLKCTTELIEHCNIPHTMKVTIHFIKPTN